MLTQEIFLVQSFSLLQTVIAQNIFQKYIYCNKYVYTGNLLIAINISKPLAQKIYLLQWIIFIEYCQKYVDAENLFVVINIGVGNIATNIFKHVENLFIAS